MKKKIILLLIISIYTIGLYAKPNYYIGANFEYSYDTNVFSNPLPVYDVYDDDTNSYPWIEWRHENPFLQRHNFGFNISSDIFFSDEGRTGLSAALSVKFPYQATSITPEGDFAGDWDYVYRDVSEKQVVSIFGAFGPVFRAQFSFMDLGVAIRVSLGAYDYRTKELVVGLQAEPYVNIFLASNAYLSIKLTYDAHLMRFIRNGNKFFDENYQMLTAAPSIGIGIKF